MPDKGYEFFEHTADTGLRIHGRTLRELFVNAANGLTAVLIEDSPIAVVDSRYIALSGASVEALLRAWLKELLFWFAAEGFLPGDYHFDTLTRTELHGRILGERFDPSRHQQGVEVKGITYHRFRVVETPGGWEAEVIFDV